MERGEGMDMMNVDLTICPPDKKGKKNARFGLS